MPLEANLPVIDDRTFDDIVTEARSRIARYTPEWAPVWTDVNDSDPGITLVQVFAWLTEMLIYRLGKVPDLNYLKFLELIGIELNPATPAQAEITFPVVATNSQPYVIVPLHTQVSAPSPSGGQSLIFETDRAIYALTAALAAILTYDGFQFDLVDSSSLAGFNPFGTAPGKDAALLLGFQYSGAFPAQIELNLDFWMAQQGSGTTSGDCSLPDSQVFPSANLTWQYWSGLGWASLGLLKDETLGLQRSGHVYLRTPGSGAMQKGSFGGVPQPLYWIRALIASGRYEMQPVILAVRTNTAPSTQAQTINDEVLGGSTGLPNQIFQIANSPILDGTLQVQIDQGDGFEDWEQVQDFFGSGPNDQVYALDRTTAQIRFGDGLNGAIPVATSTRPNNNVVARTYRYGGGKQGNVAANALTTLVNSITGIDSSKITNLFAAYAGGDEETLDDAKLRAPMALRSRDRAVTKSDFEYLAEQAANVARAFAMPLSHPSFPGIQVPGVVSVIVVPDSDDLKPLPSDGMLRTVCAYLNLRRLLTTEVYVIPPTYQLVKIHAELVALNTADLAEVTNAVQAALNNYFHPLHGGDDGTGWPFGGTIYFSRVYQQINDLPGVDRIEQVLITLDKTQYPVCQDVSIKPAALLYSTGHEVVVSYSFS
ncbi:MAG: putative baseplate assembly protein [Acidobacteriales bacterium 59-55]|nr:putative baseplate assembly protein [Terriglobales bacterium]OJV42463.1 MAG: putative baseplate assembly protein [Acidobacteriales bacterium 59-55]